jgi:1-acylglycerone phosphate reductase
VTGFVRSNILHHGLFAPEGSLYLPIKERIETIKYQGNKNGMETEAYARSVVEKLMCKPTRSEIWEGNMAKTIRILVRFLPLWLLVSTSPTISSFIGNSRLITFYVLELVLLPQIPTWPFKLCPEQ